MIQLSYCPWKVRVPVGGGFCNWKVVALVMEILVSGYKVCCFTVSESLGCDLPFVPRWNEVVSWGDGCSLGRRVSQILT